MSQATISLLSSLCAQFEGNAYLFNSELGTIIWLDYNSQNPQANTDSRSSNLEYGCKFIICRLDSSSLWNHKEAHNQCAIDNILFSTTAQKPQPLFPLKWIQNCSIKNVRVTKTLLTQRLKSRSRIHST